MPMQDGDEFTHHGLRFRFLTERDDDHGHPWDEEDGHGPVRYVRGAITLTKRCGERVLKSDRWGAWLYDWQKAAKLARQDGWNAEPFDAPHRIQRAVQADFDRMRGYLNDDWGYVGVCVILLDADGAEATDRYDNALWGIESDCKVYHEEVAHQLADEIVRPRLGAWREALKAARTARELGNLAQVMAAPLRPEVYRHA